MGVERLDAAPQTCPIDQIVVDEGGGVQHLNCRRQVQQRSRVSGEQTTSQQGKARADTLSASSDQLGKSSIERGAVSIHLRGKQRFDLFQLSDGADS